MTSNVAAQIIHESEAQRQHVRIAMPARAYINGKPYEVKDLSSGGIALTGASGQYTRGQVVAVRLELPFNNFMLGSELTAEIQHFDARKKLLGCRFTNLKPDQISLLNYIIKSFMTGHTVASDNIIDIASRNNFVAPRKSANQPKALSSPMMLNIRRQAPGLAALALLGGFVLLFVFSNLYNYFFIEKSMDGMISAPVTELRATRAGVYHAVLPADAAVVQAGEAIAEIRTGEMPVQPFTSPCDCYVAAIYPQNGQYIENGARLASLVPNDARPWMVASVTPKQAARLKIGGKVKLNVAGINAEYTGKIKEIESGMKDSTPVLDALAPSRPVKVKVELDQKLPVDFINRPAQASFSLH